MQRKRFIKGRAFFAFLLPLAKTTWALGIYRQYRAKQKERESWNIRHGILLSAENAGEHIVGQIAHIVHITLNWDEARVMFSECLEVSTSIPP